MEIHNKIPLLRFFEDDASSTPFQFFSLSHRKTKVPYDPHRHNFFELFFFEEGHGEHMIDFNVYPITSPSIHLVAPGQVHLIQRSLKSKAKVLIFSRSFVYGSKSRNKLLLELPYYNDNLSQVINLSSEKQAELSPVFSLIDIENKKGEQINSEVIKNLVQVILLRIKEYGQINSLEKTTQSKLNAKTKLAKAFKNQLELKFAEWHLVQDYAEALNVSSNYLNDSVKLRSGFTASELIQKRIILEAKRLLMHSNLSTKEIAYSLNFNDPSYFSRNFKKQVKLSPKAFKDSLAQKYKNSS